MILTVLLTLMVGKLHDGTPTRDANHGQDAGEEEEEEEMDDEETGNGENTEAGGMSTRAQTNRGGRRGIAREDQDGRSGASARQNPNMDREREWRGGQFEQYETKTAKSFRKKDMPRLMIEKSGQPPRKKVIDSWLTSAKLVMASEDLDWIVNLTHAMKKSTDTDEYYIKNPGHAGRKLLLEEEAFDTSDKGEVLKILQHLVSHKATAREYAMLRTGDKYTEDLAMQDFKEIRREMTSFNAQMMKVLEDKDGQEGFMADIQVRIRKNYGTDPNIFAGILAWRMIEEPVMSIIEKKFTEQRWENFRAEVRKYREKDNDKEKFKWNSLSTSLKNIHIRNSGEDNLASVLIPEDMQSTGFRKMKGIKHGRNVEMPPGVSLEATSYQDFQNIAAGKTTGKHTGQGAPYSKPRGDTYTVDKDVPFGRPAMIDHKWKCGVAGCNWRTFFWKRNPKDINAGMSADDVFEIAKNCVKCNAPKPDQTRRHERLTLKMKVMKTMQNLSMRHPKMNLRPLVGPTTMTMGL